MKQLRKALETIALHNSEGKASDDLLIKACDAYKTQSEFIDDYEYHVCVTKSLHDHLNGIEPDEEICKAIVPGQTKVVDGIVYIYTATPNAKTQYDWRVLKNTTAGNKIGRQVDDAKIAAKQKFVNELFPTDLSTLKVIKRLGGSTGAELVEDAKGNKYVMKKGSNTSNEHVKSEYLTNQLYDLLGLRVPDFELYEENGEAIMLSKFIPMTRMPSASDYDEMAKGFAVDALLANWDVYQNDNCLVDSAGRIIRVDNGGALEYRAQGAKKTFGKTVSDFDSMEKYNPSVVGNLSLQDKVNQIDELLKKRDDVIGFLVQSNSNLVGVFDGRFKDLQNIKNNLETKINKGNRKIVPRKLKSDADMYRELTDDELDAIWKAQPGRDYWSKLQATNYTNGWELLNAICEERGFTARPEVVDETTYWNMAKNAKYQMFRGLSSGGGHDAEYYADDFRYNDNCFYGTIGIHGSGIYAHVNDGTNNKDNTKTTYKSSDAYKNARSYAGSSGEILECILDPKANVAMVPDLKKEILSMVTFDKAAVDAKQLEIDTLNAELSKQQDDLNNITDKTEKDIKTKMHWDEDTLVMHQLEIDNTDWGATNDQGEPDYPSFEDFVEKKMFDWVKKNGGTVTEKGKGTDVYVFKLPNSKEPFMFSRFQYENNAIKRKNAFSKPYNYPVRRFADWLMKEHYNVINKKVTAAIDNIGSKVNELQADIKLTKNELNTKIGELNDLKKTKDPNGDIMSGIYESVRSGSKEAIGTYAALKGIDAIVEPHGNGGPNSFMIILNRSKVIVKK
jgi:hypothetical protein